MIRCQFMYPDQTHYISMKPVIDLDAMESYRDYIELCPKEVFYNTWKTAEVFKSQPEG